MGAQVLSTQHTFHLAFAISVTQKQLLLCFYNVRQEETGADVMCDGFGFESCLLLSNSINGSPLLLQNDIVIVPLNMPRPTLFRSLIVEE